MKKKFDKTLLIICEGTKSEPNYFHSLRNVIINNDVENIHIKVLPIPENELLKIKEDADNFILRKGAKKRTLKESINPVIDLEDYAVEDKYKAQPTSYIRKAQLAFKDKGYDELWAVYDKDGHSHHSEAYELSENLEICTKLVNIGFSSIAFELWILSHFERPDKAFTKSQCKIEGKVIDCGSENEDPNNCKGSKCVVGRIVSQNFLEYTRNKHFAYENFSPFIHNAFKNALLLREEYSSDSPFYEKNPYLTVDRLIFQLYYFQKSDHEWISTKSFTITNNIDVEISTTDGNCIVEVYNNSNTTFILEPETIKFIDTKYDLLRVNERKVLNVGESHTLAYNIDYFDYLVINKGNTKSLILDRPFIKTNIFM